MGPFVVHMNMGTAASSGAQILQRGFLQLLSRGRGRKTVLPPQHNERCPIVLDCDTTHYAMSQPEMSTATAAPAGPGPDTQNQNQNRDPEAAVPRPEPPAPESPAAKRWRWIQYGIRSLFVVTAITTLGVVGYVASQWGTRHVEKIYASVIVGVSLLSSLPAWGDRVADL